MAKNKCLDLNTLLSDLFKNRESRIKFDNYASRLLHKKTKYQFARHMQGCDIVSDIKLKFLSGEIIWNNNKSTLECFFYFRIRAEIANLVKKEKNFIPIPLYQPNSPNENDFENDENIIVDSQLIVRLDDEENDEVKIELKDIQNIIPDIFKNSEEEYCVAENMLKGLKNRDSAADLGITSNDLHNIKRRVVRKIKLLNNNKRRINKNSKNLTSLFGRASNNMRKENL